jgi:hypothetical protein
VSVGDQDGASAPTPRPNGPRPYAEGYLAPEMAMALGLLRIGACSAFFGVLYSRDSAVCYCVSSGFYQKKWEIVKGHGGPMMNCNGRNRERHSERSEESVSPGTEMLRCAQNDTAGLDR